MHKLCPNCDTRRRCASFDQRKKHECSHELEFCCNFIPFFMPECHSKKNFVQNSKILFVFFFFPLLVHSLRNLFKHRLFERKKICSVQHTSKISDRKKREKKAAIVLRKLYICVSKNINGQMIFIAYIYKFVSLSQIEKINQKNACLIANFEIVTIWIFLIHNHDLVTNSENNRN